MTEAIRIYSEMRGCIIRCELVPGAPVSEAELCARFSASRTPVREACRRLQDEGLLQNVPFRGCFIAPLTIDEYRSLNEMQLVLDPAAAAMAAERATDEQIASIEQWANYIYHPGEKRSYDTFLEWNLNFHIEIANATGNDVLIEMTTNLQTRLIRYFYLVISMANYGKELVSEHQAMVRAIHARKPDQARDRATEHVIRTTERTSLIRIPQGANRGEGRREVSDTRIRGQ